MVLEVLIFWYTNSSTCRHVGVEIVTIDHDVGFI